MIDFATPDMRRTQGQLALAQMQQYRRPASRPNLRQTQSFGNPQLQNWFQNILQQRRVR